MDVGILAKIERQEVKAAATHNLQQDLQGRADQALTAVGNQAVTNNRQIVCQFRDGTVGLSLDGGFGSTDRRGL